MKLILPHTPSFVLLMPILIGQITPVIIMTQHENILDRIKDEDVVLGVKHNRSPSHTEKKPFYSRKHV